MSYFKAKMHQIRFRLGLRPRHRWGSSQRSPGPLAGFKGELRTSLRRNQRPWIPSTLLLARFPPLLLGAALSTPAFSASPSISATVLSMVG